MLDQTMNYIYLTGRNFQNASLPDVLKSRRHLFGSPFILAVVLELGVLGILPEPPGFEIVITNIKYMISMDSIISTLTIRKNCSNTPVPWRTITFCTSTASSQHSVMSQISTYEDGSPNTRLLEHQKKLQMKVKYSALWFEFSI